MKRLFLSFIKCGMIGWSLECLFTGLDSFLHRGDPKLRSCSSIWMFPIYGLASLIRPIYGQIHRANFMIRGGIYSILIITAEYITGTLLKKKGACPWDYHDAKYNVDGVIRLDYLPIWFFVGLLYERILIAPTSHTKKGSSN